MGITLGATVVAFVSTAAALIAPTAAFGQADVKEPTIEVIQVSGLVDRVVAEFIEASLDRAAGHGAQALVIQMNTKGATVSDARMARLAEQIANSPVAIGIWVGPSGARAYGTPAQLLAAADVSGLSPNSRMGNLGDPLEVAAAVTLDFGAATTRLRQGTIGYQQSRDLGAVRPGTTARDTAVLGDFVVSMDGFVHDGTAIDTARQVDTKAGPRLQVVRSVSYKLPIVDQLMHTVASPAIAYLLLSIALLLLVFEFFTAGVGVAGLTGAACLLLGAYGVAALPHHPWALVLIVLSTVAFAVDIQTGVPRFWTAVGIVFYVVGSVRLWDGVSMSWVPLSAGIVLTVLAVLTGMPSMVRTRFATPTIGRGWMVGEMGEAMTEVSPDGVVKVRDATWRAHTNRATPIAMGDRVRVVAIDGVVLEIEPESGGARDYRERGPKTNEPLNH
jgi:membrane-bound serine protease (ClpP class)